MSKWGNTPYNVLSMCHTIHQFLIWHEQVVVILIAHPSHPGLDSHNAFFVARKTEFEFLSQQFAVQDESHDVMRKLHINFLDNE